MWVASDRHLPNPLMVPEFVGFVIGHVNDPPNLLNCACVNRTWSIPALQKLYRGSINDMRYRTPDIGSLNSLFVASRERFARNVSFIKHLLIAPENTGIDETAHPDYRYACIERCRPLRDRKSAELLLRPRGKGPASLAIPFEIVHQDLSTVSDLILHPGLKFLTIDHVYCELLELDSGPFQEPSAPPEGRLSNLTALSVHRSDSDLKIEKLCKWLERCDLELFQIDEGQQLNSLSRPHTIGLLRCLRRQRNLQALALMMRRCDPGTGKICTTLEKEEGTMSWPRLKALYLARVDRHWFEKLPTFRDLQILKLRNLVGSLPDIVKDAARSISHCQRLRVIDVEFHEVNDAEIFLGMVRGCPLLQGLCVHTLNGTGDEWTGDQFSRLLQALPHVELLSLDIKFRMDRSQLRDLASFCPRLTMLKLFQTRLRLSQTSLAEAPPLQRLEVMHLREVWFDNPSWYMRLNKLRGLAREWCRVFPRVRHLPCPADVYGLEINSEGSPSGGEPEGDGDGKSLDDHHKMALHEPGLDFHDYGSDWFNLRRRLWRLIGYGTNTEIFDRVCHMWQTNLEIETFGWPVLPMAAFLDPNRHSTSEKYER